MQADARAANPDEKYRAGDVIAGKYRLDEEVREGGMCQVWMGVNAQLELPVAIKLVHPKLRCPELARCLEREARAIAALQHPAIVRVFDLGELSPDNPYIVLERLDGEDLRQFLCREHRLPAEEAVRLLLPVASGVQAAHARGVIHRDLKPENIVLARDDGRRIEPKVLDFGIATLKWEERQEAADTTMGTVGYMPPEQTFNLGGMDHRVDIWAFSAVLYETIAGDTPFSGRTLQEMKHALIHDWVRSLVETANVDPSLWSIIERGLRLDPKNRWTTMNELGQALANWLLSRGIHEDVSGRSIAGEWLADTALDPAPSRRVPSCISTESDGRTTEPFPLLKKEGTDAPQPVRSGMQRQGANAQARLAG
jgi:serine/threonine-protein kinase